MGCYDGLKYFCCTSDGLYRLKKYLSFGTGVMVIITTVLSILNLFNTAFDLLGFIRQLWNILFGVLMILTTLQWTKWIVLRFGFLTGWFGRGMFYLFVGTNVLYDNHDNEDGGEVFFSYLVGGTCIFIGVVELLFGFKCTQSDLADEEAAKAKDPTRGGPGVDPMAGGGSRAAGEPTLSVNITPAQAAGAASWAANNAGTIAKVASAAAPAAAPAASNSGASNPFFGNQHLERT